MLKELKYLYSPPQSHRSTLYMELERLLIVKTKKSCLKHCYIFHAQSLLQTFFCLIPSASLHSPLSVWALYCNILDPFCMLSCIQVWESEIRCILLRNKTLGSFRFQTRCLKICLPICQQYFLSCTGFFQLQYKQKNPYRPFNIFGFMED